MADLQGGAQQVDGDTPHDDVDVGNPIKVGHKAIAHGANPTAVAAADRTDWYANRAGVPWVIGGHPNVISVEIRVQDSDGVQNDQPMVTIGGGLKIVVTRVEVMVDNACTQDVSCRVAFGATSLPTADLGGANGVLLSHDGIAPGSGVVTGTGAGILGVGLDGEDLRFTCEDPVGGTLRIIASYYTIES